MQKFHSGILDKCLDTLRDRVLTSTQSSLLHLSSPLSHTLAFRRVPVIVIVGRLRCYLVIIPDTLFWRNPKLVFSQGSVQSPRKFIPLGSQEADSRFPVWKEKKEQNHN